MTKERLGQWDPSTFDISWEDATITIKHAAMFYGASLAGIADLNPLYS
ncbi:MAG: hypothetical protein GH151_09355 [Bacteroidetes bacterium]|nr:hypothetical protein [Bacteroidota bacterium]